MSTGGKDPISLSAGAIRLDLTGEPGRPSWGQVVLEPVSFDTLSRWPDDNHLEAFEAFRTSACRMAGRPYSTKAIGVSGELLSSIGVRALDPSLDHADSQAARGFFEQNFTPYRIVADRAGGRRPGTGLVTGYFEPEAEASFERNDRFRFPVYRRPEDLAEIDEGSRPADMAEHFFFARRTGNGYAEYHDRRAIESGALDVLELPRPDPGESRRWYFRRTRDGRSMYVVSSDGPMVVVGVDQLRVISDASFSCPTPQAPLLSPSGRFAAWTCVDYGEIEIPLECLNRPTETDSDGDACAEAIDEATADSQTVGTVARVSLAAGLERFEGVPMWLSAVDDDGGLLMWSRDTGSGIESSEPAAPPRNLYVLSAGGRVALVDGLEPTPVSSLAIDGATPRWISARAL